ncbi:VOC family protein [Leptospira wolffii]|uniref:VOC family protein n=1 Tax=Leptospira wolffii TaxID=409998 RepID=A0A2M9ZF04_9LEPT|nr:VOC family protein [Leptospira wolffii]EPG64749.1 glyoxalase-like domain protein [Leptospira wolffii serovar Khorat str. Khorat-H2]PJZ66954.1 VOC family protein [Leptospira wolffii]TGL52015.1 VOC family protein [Leptospira wolffii]
MIIVEGIDYIVIPTGDLSASVKFYSELFDFEPVEEKGGDFAIIGLDSVNLKLLNTNGVKGALSEAKSPVLSFVLDVDDFTEAIVELESKAVQIVRGPEARDGGEFLHFLDPSGNILEINYKESR